MCIILNEICLFAFCFHPARDLCTISSRMIVEVTNVCRTSYILRVGWLYCILGLHFLMLNSRKLVYSLVRIGNCSQMIREVRSHELCSVFSFIRSYDSWFSYSKICLFAVPRIACDPNRNIPPAAPFLRIYSTVHIPRM